VEASGFNSGAIKVLPDKGTQKGKGKKDNDLLKRARKGSVVVN
jgi:hypothetical protein